MAHTIEDQHDDASRGARPTEAANEAAETAPRSSTPEPVAAAVDQDLTRAGGEPQPTSPAPRRRSLRPVRQGARRTRVVIRNIGPLSVLKFSLIFYFCVMLIVFFALAIIYAILSAAGAMEEIGKLLGYFFGTGETGTRDPEPIAINGGVVFTWLFFAGLVFTAVWSVINVFVAFLYNLISDVVGGIDVTLAEKPPR